MDATNQPSDDGGNTTKADRTFSADVKPYVQTLTINDLDSCMALENATFPPQERCSPPKFKYRFTVCPELSLGLFNVLKPCLPHLVASAQAKRGGSVIFVSATFHYTGFPLQAHVSSAKAAVDALAASVAIEYGPLGVRSNVIAPGPIAETEGMKRLAGLSSKGLEGTASAVPLGKLGEVRDIADATVYLFSAAGSYVNGHALVVDGGAWRIMASGNEKTGSYPSMFINAAKL